MQALITTVPKLFTLGGSLLYIGGGPGKVQLMTYLKDEYECYLLEASQDQINGLGGDEGFKEVFLGNVVEAAAMFRKGRFDVTVWWHGPEHIPYCFLDDTTLGLEIITNKLVILGAPYGFYPQGEIGGNIFDWHYSALYPMDFWNLGYEVYTIGQQDTGSVSCMIGWKEL